MKLCLGLGLFAVAAGVISVAGSTRSLRASVQKADVGAGRLGAIEGRALFQGQTVPGPTMIDNATDPEICGTRHSLEDLLISKKNRGIQNVIVALVSQGSPLPRSSPQRKLVLDNHKCRFQPHVAVLPAGSTIEAVNSDPMFHTTHLYYGGLSKNLALTIGVKASQVVSRPGFIIIKCDIHGWMKAFVRVDDHSFHAISDADGRFRIANIPQGSYMLEAWHESLGEQKLSVTVSAGKTVTVEIKYR